MTVEKLGTRANEPFQPAALCNSVPRDADVQESRTKRQLCSRGGPELRLLIRSLSVSGGEQAKHSNGACDPPDWLFDEGLSDISVSVRERMSVHKSSCQMRGTSKQKLREAYGQVKES
jgi:hypothetical protein